MTATISKGDISATKEFPVTVFSTNGMEQATREVLEIIAADITEESITDEPRMRLTKDLSLPTEIITGKAADIGGVNITWESNYPAIVSAEGKITQHPYEAAATLTAIVAAKADPSVSVRKDLKFAVDAGGKVYHYFTFEDMPVESAGEEIDTWSAINKRAAASGAEYGTQFFADKEPSQSTEPYKEANKVLFLNRYTSASYDTVASMSHTTIEKEVAGDYYYGDVLALSFRMKFTSPDDMLKMATYCLHERYTYFGPDRLTISNNTLAYYPGGGFALNEWHDVAMYFDTISWRLDVYVDGDHIVSEPIEMGTGAYQYLEEWRFFNDRIGYIFLDDVLLRSISVPKGGNVVPEAVAQAYVPATLTEDYDLPNRIGRCAVTWRSSDESVISDSGQINPDPSVSKSATLTATFRHGTAVDTKTFQVTVPAQTPYKKDYALQGITVANGRITGVSVKRINEESQDAKLFILLYDKGACCGLYRYDLPAMTAGAVQSVAPDISLDSLTNYKIKAYIWDYSAAAGGLVSNYCIQEGKTR